MTRPEHTTRILRRLLASGLTGRAERLLARVHPADVGPLVADLGSEELRTVVELLVQQRRAAETLATLPPDVFRRVAEALGDDRLASVLARCEVDDMAALVDELPEERRADVVALLPEEARTELHKVELYPEGSAGRVMTTDFVALEAKMTAQEAIDHLRARSAATPADAILYLYVVDEDGRLRGVVPIRRLVTAAPDRRCGELMLPAPVSVRADTDQEQVAAIVSRYDLLAVPVTDADDRVLGVITVDDVIDVIHEEATEDIYHLAGLSGEDRVFSPAHQSARRRLPWMLANLATAFLASWVVGLFERTIQEIVALAVFLPIVAGMGGNAATQTLTVVTRAIALGEIEFSTGLRAVAKELAVGTAIGAVTGLVSAGIVWAWDGNPWLGIVLLLAMIANLAVAGLVGAAVPLALKALRQDPALGAGVIVTTFTDCCGFFAFLGIATLFLDRLV